MAMSSGNGKVSSLKTYSRRVTNNTEGPPSRRKLIDIPLPVKPSPPAKKIARSSIQSYFTLLPSSSSLTPARSQQHSSDELDLGSTSPSSPPEKADRHVAHLRLSQKRRRRRLTTKPTLPPIARMCDHISESSDDSRDGQSIYNGCGYPQSKHNCGHISSEEDEYFSAQQFKPYNKDNYDAEGNYLAEFRCPHGCFPQKRKPSAVHNVSDDINSNRSTTSSTSRPLNYHQTRIDIGGPTVKQCTECLMTYDQAIPADRRSHQIHHDSVLNCSQGGLDLTEATVDFKYIDNVLHRVCAIDRLSSPSLRGYAERVAARVDAELGYPKDTELWGEVRQDYFAGPSHMGPQYKCFILMVAEKPCAAIITEAISEGGAYFPGILNLDSPYNIGRAINQSFGTLSYPKVFQEWLSLDKKFNCVMSIDRIWVVGDHQRKGYATLLADIARQNFLPGTPLSKAEIAFSRPTAVGYEFAKNYCRGVFKDVDILVNLAEASSVGIIKDNEFVSIEEREA